VCVESLSLSLSLSLFSQPRSPFVDRACMPVPLFICVHTPTHTHTHTHTHTAVMTKWFLPSGDVGEKPHTFTKLSNRILKFYLTLNLLSGCPPPLCFFVLWGFVMPSVVMFSFLGNVLSNCATHKCFFACMAQGCIVLECTSISFCTRLCAVSNLLFGIPLSSTSPVGHARTHKYKHTGTDTDHFSKMWTQAEIEAGKKISVTNNCSITTKPIFTKLHISGHWHSFLSAKTRTRIIQHSLPIPQPHPRI